MRSNFVKVYSEEPDLFPRRVTDYSLYDVFAKTNYDMWSWKQTSVGIHTLRVRTGVYVDLGPHVAIVIRSKSGLGFKNDIVVFHGYIDPDYRGEIMIKLFAFGDPIPIKKGQAVAQIQFVPANNVILMKAVSREELSKTERGHNGFGALDFKHREVSKEMS